MIAFLDSSVVRHQLLGERKPLAERTQIERATGPMPAVVGTLDRIHLATALALARALDVPPGLVARDRSMRALREQAGSTVADPRTVVRTTAPRRRPPGRCR